MNRTEKEQLVAELKDKIKSAPALYYTDFTGLNVKRMTDLRRRLRAGGLGYGDLKMALFEHTWNFFAAARARLEPARGRLPAATPKSIPPARAPRRMQ